MSVSKTLCLCNHWTFMDLLCSNFFIGPVLGKFITNLESSKKIPLKLNFLNFDIK